MVVRRRELADPEGAAAAKAEDAELRAARKRIRELEMENEFLKKSERLLREGAGAVNRYRLMAAERARYPVKLTARVPSASRSGFYAWARRPAPKDA